MGWELKFWNPQVYLELPDPQGPCLGLEVAVGQQVSFSSSGLDTPVSRVARLKCSKGQKTRRSTRSRPAWGKQGDPVAREQREGRVEGRMEG